MVSTVKADTLTYTATHPSSLTEWTDNFVLTQFDPALGSLQSVYIAATETVDMNGTVYNGSTGPQTFNFQAGSMLTVTLPGVLGFLQPSPLAAFIPYVNLPSMTGAPYGPINASQTVNYTYTAPVDMALFTGTGTVTLPGYTLTLQTIAGGGGNISAVLNTYASASVQVVYEYIPVPEPGMISLFAVGAFLLLRRRQ